MAELPYWLAALYTHTVDLWKPDRQLTGTDWSQANYSPAEAGVRCFQNRNPSVSQLELFGRTEQDDIFTLDIFWFTVGQVVDEGWCLVNKTLNPDGSQSPNYGKGWITRGCPRVLLDQPNAPGGHIEIVAGSIPKLPTGVSV